MPTALCTLGATRCRIAPPTRAERKLRLALLVEPTGSDDPAECLVNTWISKSEEPGGPDPIPTWSFTSSLKFSEPPNFGFLNAIDQTAAQLWAKQHGYELNSRLLPALRDAPELAPFLIPGDAGQRVARVRRDMEIFRDEDTVCVWLFDWNVWPSGQWGHLFQRFRISYGITAPLEERPALLIPRSEFDAAISTVVYSVLMLWDCHVLATSGRPFLFYSHDEHGRKRASVVH